MGGASEEPATCSIACGSPRSLPRQRLSVQDRRLRRPHHGAGVDTSAPRTDQRPGERDLEASEGLDVPTEQARGMSTSAWRQVAAHRAASLVDGRGDVGMAPKTTDHGLKRFADAPPRARPRWVKHAVRTGAPERARASRSAVDVLVLPKDDRAAIAEEHACAAPLILQTNTP